MILVTGAAGFLGRYVCAHLRSSGIPYTGIDRTAGEGCRACDITDADAVAAVFRDGAIDTVIHLAAVLATASRTDPLLATRVHVTAGAGLLDAAARFGVRRFVFGSSMSVYGAEGDGTPLNEDVPPAPDDVYGAAKRYLEICGAAFAARSGFRFISLRMAIVIGPGARNTSSTWRSEIFEKRGASTPQRIVLPFAPETVLSLVRAEDAARMLALLATRDEVHRDVYHSPAGNWTAGQLAQAVEQSDRHITVQLDPARKHGAAPASDGARFAREFAFAKPGTVHSITDF